MFLVPCAITKCDAMECIKIKGDTSYYDVLDHLHKIIGHLTGSKRPEISYQLSTSTTKSTLLSPIKEKDWEGLVDNVIDIEQTGKV